MSGSVDTGGPVEVTPPRVQGFYITQDFSLNEGQYVKYRTTFLETEGPRVQPLLDRQ